MDASEANIARALLDPSVQDEVIKQETLRFAVQRQIICPYTRQVLDIREAVLLDGGDRGKSDIMTASYYDAVIDRFGTLEALQEALGYQVEVLDGRVLFGGGSEG